LNGSIFAIALLNKYSPPAFQEETNLGPFWGMFAAEVRHRAAGDGSFLLPGGQIVKRGSI